jgi:luciferase family oxidoreductase group 1
VVVVTSLRRLGVLDLCKRGPGLPPHQVLRESLELAGVVDELGYTRYWVAEHHTADAAQSSPEVLIPLIAERTPRLRVGAGAILLPYYSPIKVAEVFLALEALFPGRIDLGVARGPGVVAHAGARALVDGHEDELAEPEFRRKLADLQAYLERRAPADPALSGVAAHPLDVSAPALWVLGTGPGSAALAVAHGTRYGVSLFFPNVDPDDATLLDYYRAEFVPRHDLTAPRAVLAVSALCAATDAAARAMDTELIARGYHPSNVVGTPGRCRERLWELAERHGVDEILVATWPVHFEARLRTYELLANACDDVLAA